jgi:hypothetical protein
MEKYVKLEDVKALLKRLNNEPQYQHAGETYYAGIAAVDMELDTLPTIEVEKPSPYAEWISEGKSFLGSDYRCSGCGKLADEGNSGHFNILTAFCKNCGRRMKAKEN